MIEKFKIKRTPEEMTDIGLNNGLEKLAGVLKRARLDGRLQETVGCLEGKYTGVFRSLQILRRQLNVSESKG